VITWQLLADTNSRFEDLGADHYTCLVNPDTKKRNYFRQVEALGYTVTLTPSRLTCHPPAGPTGVALSTSTHRIFGPEFREGAVRIVRETGKPIAQFRWDTRKLGRHWRGRGR